MKLEIEHENGALVLQCCLHMGECLTHPVGYDYCPLVPCCIWGRDVGADAAEPFSCSFSIGALLASFPLLLAKQEVLASNFCVFYLQSKYKVTLTKIPLVNFKKLNTCNNIFFLV